MTKPHLRESDKTRISRLVDKWYMRQEEQRSKFFNKWVHQWSRPLIKWGTYGRVELKRYGDFVDTVGVRVMQTCDGCGSKRSKLFIVREDGSSVTSNTFVYYSRIYRSGTGKCFLKRHGGSAEQIWREMEREAELKREEEEPREPAIKRNLEIVLRFWGIRGRGSRVERKRRDYAVYRLYRSLHLSPSEIVRLMNRYLWEHRDLVRSGESDFVTDRRAKSRIQRIVGRIFKEQCLKTECALKPYLEV